MLNTYNNTNNLSLPGPLSDARGLLLTQKKKSRGTSLRGHKMSFILEPGLRFQKGEEVIHSTNVGYKAITCAQVFPSTVIKKDKNHTPTELTKHTFYNIVLEMLN